MQVSNIALFENSAQYSICNIVPANTFPFKVLQNHHNLHQVLGFISLKQQNYRNKYDHDQQHNIT